MKQSNWKKWLTCAIQIILVAGATALAVVQQHPFLIVDSVLLGVCAGVCLGITISAALDGGDEP